MSDLPIMEPPLPQPPAAEEYTPGFIVSHQKIELEFDFARQVLLGRTELTILPQRKDLKEVRLNARQCIVPLEAATINGRSAAVHYEDPYDKLDIKDYIVSTVEQHEMQKERLKPLLQTKAVPGELTITLPRSVRVEDLNPFSEPPLSVIRDRPPVIRAASGAVSAGGTGVSPISSTPIMTPRTTEDQSLRFAPLTVSVRFTVAKFRDGLQWVGLAEGDTRYPHVFSRNSMFPGIASCIFPCIDDPAMRCTWEIVLKCGRTLGDALKEPHASHKVNGIHGGRKDHVNDKSNGVHGPAKSSSSDDRFHLSKEDRALEMNVICSGELITEVSDPEDSSKKIVSFVCSTQVAPQHIGFAIGPFEQVDLSEFREDDGNEKLGQGAVAVYGYCLPGRVDEVRSTCQAMCFAVDWFSLNVGSYPFQDYKICFVDDQSSDTVQLASLSLCSTRLLVPEDIIDPEIEVTRQLIQSLACQWIGVSIIASTRADNWAVIGISHFVTGLCMQKLCGNNDYRFRQKTLADKLVQIDIQRPSIYALGEILHLGQFEMDFMALKAPLVLFILDRRLTKISGGTGLIRVISKLVLLANMAGQLSEKTISTEGFRKLCEKTGHARLDTFFNQWVLGAGCPRFQVTQKFNKKRFIVEMTIRQTQEETSPSSKKLEKEAFLREFKEETHGVYAGDIQPAFSGPMTIRIHESDGTPYEHIVEIREGVQKFEIPYHTKYKRLKRNRKEKERATAAAGIEVNADNQDDVLLYCLGDVLQSPEDIKEWKFAEWGAEMEQKMDAESYEWIRMDADFEWICELTINMPPYMYLSQLQQDRDVVAQQDSMLFLGKTPPHPLVSTFLTRTLMDRRYFHGIREMAARYLPAHATEGCNWIGRIHLEKAFQEFFCYPGSSMPRSNDFSDKIGYIIKCAIPKAMAQVRNNEGKCPVEARQFILDQLRFNDNGNNEYSDYYYICTLLEALVESLIPKKNAEDGAMNFSFEEEDEDEFRNFQKIVVEEIDRYRRMDEWIQSYQNIYSVTALACMQRLVKAKIMPADPMRFFAYTHDGTSDLVRIKAFDALIDVGYLLNDGLLRYFLIALSTDPSPFVRKHLFQILGMGLGAIALGENKQKEVTPPPDDGLIIEHDTSLDSKKALKARTTSIDGALAAMKAELKDNEVLKEALWDAISSHEIGLLEQADFLDICYILYDPDDSMILKLQYPTYYKGEYHGKGLMVFRKTKNIRMVRIPKLTVNPAKPPPPLPAPTPIASISFGSMKPPKRPSPPSRTDSSSSATQRQTKIVKFSLPVERLRKFTHSPPLPSPTIHAPPSALSHAQSPTVGGPPKVRVPLPSSRVPLPNVVPAEPLKRPSLTLKLSYGGSKKPSSS